MALNNQPSEGSRTHAKCIEHLDGSIFDFHDVMPIFERTYKFICNQSRAYGNRRLYAKFPDKLNTDGFTVTAYKSRKINISDIIGPVTLRKKGFNAFLRSRYEDCDEMLGRFPVQPDLWFHGKGVKANRNIDYIGAMELVNTSDITHEKLQHYIEMADRIDYYSDTFFVLIKRHIDSPWYTCEVLC
jgi:hypothetical protein